MEIAPIEMEIAHDEIVRAIVEKRPHVVVLHPITDGGEQLSFYGTITGITRITAAHAEEMKKTRDEAAERNEAQRQLLLGRTPGRRGVLG
jgi:methylmalonyl-CoA mutase cobalamin-binding subunit